MFVERNIKVDEAGFEAAMEEQRRRAREASGFGADYNAMIRVDSASEFKGYDHLELNGKVTALFVDGKAVDAINAGEGSCGRAGSNAILCGIRRSGW